MFSAALFPVVLSGSNLSPAASAWRARIGAAGSSIAPAALRIMDREWFRPIASEGLSAKLLDYNWLVGPADLTGALVKPATLVSGDFIATSANFVSSTDYSATSGLKGNGSNKRIDTKVPLSAINPNSVALIWAAAEMDTTGSRRVMSARDGGTQILEFTQSSAESIALTSGGTSASANGASAVASAVFVVGHNATNATFIRNAGTPSTGTGATLTQWTASTTLNLFCRNNAGSFFDFSNGRAVFSGVASALTTAEAQRVSALIRATVLALGGPTLY